MAIVEMQKLSICANKKHRKAILETLQSMGIMELSYSNIDEDSGLTKMDTQAARTKYEKRAASFEQALKLLSQYAPSDGDKTGLFYEKPRIARSEIDKAVARFGKNESLGTVFSTEEHSSYNDQDAQNKRNK